MNDVVVLGAGPGGYVAAIKAAQMGLKTTIIEKQHLGGVCLNFGCIPTKALLHCAHIKHMMDHGDTFGFKVNYTYNFDDVIQRSRRVADQLRKGVEGLLKKNKVNVISGHGRFEDSQTISVNGEKVKGQSIIIATGARSRMLPLIPHHERVWTSKQALLPPFFPKSLVIIGSGAIGMEFASFYNTFGTKVTVIEVQASILPQEDSEISAMAKKIFEKQGIIIKTSSQLNKVEATDAGVTCHVGSEILQADAMIVAIGIEANIEDIGLERTKVTIERGSIVTNGYMQTKDPSIYAIGDVCGAPWLAHKATHEGIISVEHIKGLSVQPLDTKKIPGCVYSLPQIASIGLSEDKAKTLGRKLKIGRFPYHGNGKALAMDHQDGMIKTIFDDETGELIGAHMIGGDVSELISIFSVAKHMEGVDVDFIHTVFPHPTLSEMIHESVLNSHGKAIHI